MHVSPFAPHSVHRHGAAVFVSRWVTYKVLSVNSSNRSKGSCGKLFMDKSLP